MLLKLLQSEANIRKMDFKLLKTKTNFRLPSQWAEQVRKCRYAITSFIGTGSRKQKKNWMKCTLILLQAFSSVQSLSHVQLFVTPWTAARQASQSFTNSRSLHKLMSTELVIHLTISSSVVPFSFCLHSFPTSGSFQKSQLFRSGGQSIGVSTSTSVLPMNTQGWSPLGWTGWISL